MLVIKDKTMCLIYSEDDNEYYWERLDDWKVSQSFKTSKAAILARQNNKLIWVTEE